MLEFTSDLADGKCELGRGQGGRGATLEAGQWGRCAAPLAVRRQ